MPHSDKERADRFMLDTIRLAFALDAISSRDWPDSITLAVRHGYLLFAELLHKRTNVALPPEDEKVMDCVLEAIQARLKFLERFHCCNLPN